MPAGQEFSKQYQRQMGQIQERYQQPFQAQQMAQTMGMQGFQSMPSPVFMTPPSMGAFRPDMQPPPPVSVARTPPMIRTPLTPQLPQPMFQTPLQMQQRQQEEESTQKFSVAMAGIPTAARVGAGIAGTAAGAAIGGRVGGMLGARGRGIGQVAGAIGGGLLGFGPGGRAVEQGAEAVTAPAIEQRAFGLQMQDISRNFAVSGPDLSEGGRGLSQRAGIQTANKMRKAVKDEETSGFNMRDMMGISSMAGDMGMMDMAQNSEQIVGQAKNIAKGLSAFMRLANEPDVRRAMQQMSQMRSMGLTVPETAASMQNAQQFARMAGTSVASLSQNTGMPGAMTFQRQGMTGGLGMNVGMAAGGMASQAVASGAFTPGQLNMAGGQSGISQQLTEAATANLGVSFPMMAMLKRNDQGQLAIDQEKRQRIDSGEVSLTEQAGMAQRNVEQLGGASVITELSTRLNELKDELGKQRGPMGSILSTLQQGIAMQKELGGKAAGIGIGGALRALGLDPQQARTMEIMTKSPQFWRSMTQQMQQQKTEARREETTRRQRMADTSDLTAQIGRSGVVRGAAQIGSRIGSMVSGAYDSASQWFSDQSDEREAADEEAVSYRKSEALGVTSNKVQQELNKFVRSGGAMRSTDRERAELTRGTGDTPAGEGSEVLAEANLFSAIGRSVFGIAGTAETSNLVRAQRAAGGVMGFMAKVAPSLTYTASMVMGTSKEIVAHGESVAEVGKQMTQGKALSENAMGRLTREGAKAFNELQRQAGEKTEKGAFGNLQDTAVRAIIGELENRSSWMGNKAMSSEEMRTKAIEAAVKDGKKREVAEKIYSKERWKGGIGQLVMRRVDDEAGPDAQGSLGETFKNQGSTEAMTGSDLKEVVKNLEKQEDQTKKDLGFYQGKRTLDFIDVTEEGYKAVTDMMMTSSADDILATQAQALIQSDNDEDQARGRQMLKNLRGRMSEEDAAKAVDKANKRVAGMDDDAKKALRRSSKTLEGGSAEAQKEKVEQFKTDLKKTRARAQIAEGAADLSKGMKGLQGLARGGFTKEATISSMRAILADPSQMEEAAKNPELMKALKALEDAGEDEKKQEAAAAQFQGTLQTRGQALKDKTKFGGKGVGGAEESRIDKQIGAIETMAGAGDTQGAFAKSVPLFAKASAQLAEASKNLKQTAEVQALANKMRPSR